MGSNNQYEDEPAINWQQPWLAHIPQACHGLTTPELTVKIRECLQADGVHTASLAHQNNANDKPVHFIEQDDLPEGTAYETHIFNTGGIPTRHNLHDLFNACVWFSFPQTKILLNSIQASQIREHGVTNKRGSVRDAITLFDENGAILVTADENVATAFNLFDWQNTLVKPRQLWNQGYDANATAQVEVYLFGHAIMEQLVTPRKPLCSHTLTLQVAPEWFNQDLQSKRASVDAMLVEFFSNITELNTRSYQPLPVLGVPHFWAENADTEFYNDDFVFRSGRRKKKN